ncbi:group III truncated hemoglobin [Niveispirillum sp. KHB5.9]|uniref:group III truncated hemoglobin n=1 Tax=Niveispirillum sp. KHB5.9 TaxID=3400269 RepID=UPI003A8BCF75
MNDADPPYPRIDDTSLAALIVAFYANVRLDPLLGPVFHAMVGEGDDEWAAHLRRVHDFWSSVTMGTGRYGGRPMQVHAGIPGLEAAHFQRWLALFAETADRLFTPQASAFLRDKAERMAQALQQGIAMARSG